MAGRVEGKVAFITGAARGQGRSHAVRLAEEGADIIAVDICEQIESNPYPLATEEDLAETAKLVEKFDRRIVTVKADVRDRQQLKSALDEGLAALGRLDVVVANAGILPMAMGDPHASDFVDAVDVDLVGVMNAVAVAMPHLGKHASVVITGSTAAMLPNTTDNPAMGPGSAGYGWAKKTLMGYAEQLALHLAPEFIRVNVIHPTNVNTHLLHNDGLYSMFRPDLENPTREDVEPAFTMFQAMPIPYVEPVDISNAVLFFASDDSRYVTGQQLRVDAGSLLKMPGGPAGS
ncbi:mycofactocin-coupled SDR family oxidoreductase [Gordonia insulae]|jgi:SDR family mycofactocin-dependent oxidoreductase|uniref:Short-chain type dehydrogenase/reductase n=1 Tax=Gordonia insulae TaxID=2420509 RepID=A0A3G8JKI6_9ACTN|nr:mycofactocin-coupled SDR family oxidoreductase [Gordonia insulae]AZG45513.1 Putative short-chain type dehydrogenase/reductase [Gordonia insulae]